jgi:hypothetical protein
LAHTGSVCPHCLRRLPAVRVAYGDDVYLRKTCPEHGEFRTVIWRGLPAFESWVKPKTPSYPDNPFTTVDRGCPFDCGLCPDHRQHPCCVLLEVTQRCGMGCPVCFADAGPRRDGDPDLAEIERWYRRLLEAGGPFNVQLSGGEPTLRDDLPEIIRCGRSLGFTFFQLNTNGHRIATDPQYLARLRDAGLSTVFLQFDGLDDAVHVALRGHALADRKRAAIEACQQHRVGVVLVPTLVPGVNTDQTGAIIDFALTYSPTVRGVHFQPISYFGRYPHPPSDADRITIPEIIRAVQEQTGGRIRGEDFVPPGGENALCSFHANFVVMPGGELRPLTRHQPQLGHPAESPVALGQAASGSCCGPAPLRPQQVPPASSCCQPPPADEGAAQSREFVARHWSVQQDAEVSVGAGGPSLGEWDLFLDRLRTHTFCLSGMAFQDAWNLDLDRLRDCYIHNLAAQSPSGSDGSGEPRLVPFCAYNLTDAAGTALHRRRTTPVR